MIESDSDSVTVILSESKSESAMTVGGPPAAHERLAGPGTGLGP